MNEEEKEAFKLLKNMVKNEPEVIRLSHNKGVYALIKILSLIEKQQKEIEKYRKLRADIIKVNKKIYDVDIIEDMCEQLANSISKDKIKELREIDNIDLIQFKIKELLGE